MTMPTFTMRRLLDLFGLETGKVKRWKSPT